MAVNQLPVLEPRQLNDADRSILDELHQGRATPGYLSDQTDIEQTYINQRLRRLEEHGHVRNPSRGLWEVTHDPREDVEGDEPSGELEKCRERLQECREELTALKAEHDDESGDSVDVTRLRSLVEELEASLERGEKQAAQNALRRLRNTVE